MQKGYYCTGQCPVWDCPGHVRDLYANVELTHEIILALLNYEIQKDDIMCLSLDIF